MNSNCLSWGRPSRKAASSLNLYPSFSTIPFFIHNCSYFSYFHSGKAMVSPVFQAVQNLFLKYALCFANHMKNNNICYPKSGNHWQTWFLNHWANSRIKKECFLKIRKTWRYLSRIPWVKKVTKPEISLSEVPKKIQTNDIHHKKNGSWSFLIRKKTSLQWRRPVFRLSNYLMQVSIRNNRQNNPDQTRQLNKICPWLKDFFTTS